jgi:response regulator of citrate/malate metabolism
MESRPDTRVIMITAVGQDATIDECKKLGAADYIIKPFDAKLVAKTVEECLGVVHSR